MTYTMQTVEQNLLPSATDLIVSWLKTRTPVTDICQQRISTSMPVREEDTEYPWLTVERVIGIALLPQAAIDRPRMQFNAWGGVKPNEAPNWVQADNLIRAVEREIRTTHKARVDGKGIIMSCRVLEGIQQLEDPDTGGARFWMDAIFVLRKEDTG